MGYHFDILRNESASTDKPSEHKGPWSAPHLVSVLVLCLLLYSSLNFALSQGPALVQATKSGSKMPLRLQLSAVITFHTHLTPVCTWHDSVGSRVVVIEQPNVMTT